MGKFGSSRRGVNSNRYKLRGRWLGRKTRPGCYNPYAHSQKSEDNSVKKNLTRKIIFYGGVSMLLGLAIIGGIYLIDSKNKNNKEKSTKNIENFVQKKAIDTSNTINYFDYKK